ncbi:hypothetical protein CSHISOI_09186 [Colletotrichum shisoi]|uniref:Uncharacterized protein n=1 Tax=Colletotrichum shisoi TaxID=2078593 RepID=A0A5Q4BHJ0_9PEZI|nr:hypothetical protein CSHISOI_09186 [Colletotrichum shisoi]
MAEALETRPPSGLTEEEARAKHLQNEPAAKAQNKQGKRSRRREYRRRRNQEKREANAQQQLQNAGKVAPNKALDAERLTDVDVQPGTELSRSTCHDGMDDDKTASVFGVLADMFSTDTFEGTSANTAPLPGATTIGHLDVGLAGPLSIDFENAGSSSQFGHETFPNEPSSDQNGGHELPIPSMWGFAPVLSYSSIVGPPPRTVTIHSADGWNNMLYGDFTPLGSLNIFPCFHFTDLLVRELVADPARTAKLTQITVGNSDCRNSLTDDGLEDLACSCPALEYLTIHGAVKISDRGFQAVIDRCLSIRRIALCGMDYEPNNVCGSALVKLIEQPFAALCLEGIVLRNTAVHPLTVRRLREHRSQLKISAGQ